MIKITVVDDQTDFKYGELTQNRIHMDMNLMNMLNKWTCISHKTAFEFSVHIYVNTSYISAVDFYQDVNIKVNI